MNKLEFEFIGKDFGFVDYQAVLDFPDDSHQMVITATWDDHNRVGHITSFVTDENASECGYANIRKNLSLDEFRTIVRRNPLEYI